MVPTCGIFIKNQGGGRVIQEWAIGLLYIGPVFRISCGVWIGSIIASERRLPGLLDLVFEFHFIVFCPFRDGRVGEDVR